MALLPVPDSRAFLETPDDEVWTLGWHVGQVEAETLCPARGAAMPLYGETAPLGAICTESGLKPDAKAGAVVSATYRKPKRLDTETGVTEVKRFGPSLASRGLRLSGTRIFLAPDATAQAEIAAHLPAYRAWTHEATATVTGTVSGPSTALVATAGVYDGFIIGRTLTIAAGSFPITAVDATTRTITVTGDATCVAQTFTIGGDPYLLSAQTYPDWRGGLTRIVTQWGQLSFWHRRELVPGAGVLEGGGQMIGEKTGYDLDAAVIDADWWDVTHHYRYEAVAGSAIIPVPKVTYRIRVVLTSAGLATCAALFGKSNAAACANIGGAGIKTLWFNGFAFRQSEHASTLYQAVIDLAYHAANWDNWLKVKKKEQKAVRFQLFDTAGADTGIKQTQLIWQPTADAVESRRIIATGDFAALNGYVT